MSSQLSSSTTMSQNSTTMTTTTSTRKVVLLMTVDIGDGRSDTIIVHADDECEDLAMQFQKKHDLSEDVIVPLSEYIRSNVSELSHRKQLQQQQQQSQQNSTIKSNGLNQSIDRSTTSALLNDVFEDSNNYHNRSSFVSMSQQQQVQMKKNEDAVKAASKKRNERITAGMSYFQKPVFDRLHETAKHKEAKLLQAKMESEISEQRRIEESKVPMSNTSKRIVEELDRSRSVVQRYSNYGEFLFSEAKTLKERQEEMIQHQRKLIDAKQELEATFQPRINTNYKFIMNNNRDVLERVMEKSVRRPKDPATLDEPTNPDFTYKPKISKNSERLAKERKLRESTILDDFTFKEEDDLHEQLFRDAELRQKKKQESMCYLPSQATFKPEVRKSSFLRMEDSEEFINRLVNSKKETDKHIAQLRTQLYSSNIDQETGRELFKPIISKYSLNENFRYSRNYMENPKTKMIEEYEEEIKKKANQTHTNPNSQKLAELAKVKKISELFEFLDTDQDGYINIEDIGQELMCLEPEMVQEMQHVFNQFTSDNVSLDEFINQMLARIEETRLQGAKTTLLTSFSRKSADLRRKRLILEGHGTSAEDLKMIDENYTFKPKVNKHSEVIVSLSQERRRAKSAGRIHEVLIGEQERWRQKKEIRKEEIMQSEMAECTFRPDTSKTSLKKSRYASPDSHEPLRIEDVANRLMLAKQKKLALIHQNSEQRELQEYCSFTPKINKTSSARSPSVSHYPQHDLNASYSQIYIGRGSKPDPNSSTMWKRPQEVL